MNWIELPAPVVCPQSDPPQQKAPQDASAPIRVTNTQCGKTYRNKLIPHWPEAPPAFELESGMQVPGTSSIKTLLA
jgi:hypothetical protein